jgi:hypothetical protein
VKHFTHGTLVGYGIKLTFLACRSRSLDLTEEGGVRAAGSSIDFAFPPELSDALRRLYHLRRGALLSPGPMQSNDDRAHIRSLFLRLPLEDCLCMMAPSLWSSGIVGVELLSSPDQLEEIHPESLALWETVRGCTILHSQVATVHN